MTFEKGTLIHIDYVAKVKDTKEVFDTTIEDEAKKHSLHDPNEKYQPKLVSVGESWVIKGLDEALANGKVGDEKTIEISPEKGFGERDAGKVRKIPLRKLGEDAEKVSVGDTIEIDDKKGIIRYIGSGRVQIDYNHRFAGKTILYDIKILKSLDTDDEKILGILKRHMPVENSKIIFKKNNNFLDITIPEELYRTDVLPSTKHFIQLELFKFIPSLEKINYIESYQNKQKKPQEKKTESTVKEKTVQQKIT